MKFRPRVRLDSSLPAPGWRMGLSSADLWLECSPLSLHAVLRDTTDIRKQWADPLEALAWMERPQNFPDPTGRWVGYLSYELGQLFERLPHRAVDDLNVPLFIFAFVLPGAGMPQSPACEAAALELPCGAPPRSNFTRSEYEAAVARGIEYIAAGDVFQVNLSQRFTAPCSSPPAAIYQRLLDHAPAWYGALLEYEDFALVSNSPELFLRVAPGAGGSRTVVTRPIKGTRPRARGMELALRDSLKDQAELNMIIDLERNDLGRVCEIGSVRVTQARVIESHPTVFHGAATIEGTLGRDIGLVELLRATFPGGSITGAPKIRAMQIIDELEPNCRGPYCGAIGYVCADGQLQFNIAIRTMILAGGRVHIPVGGGIVADSTPAAEYEETLVKARAMFAAIGAG